MRITTTEEYGLRLAMQLAAAFPEGLTLPELSQREGIPQALAAKVLARLREAGLVRARRGRRGGYELVDPPQAISLDKVFRALGDPLFHAAFCQDHGGELLCCIHASDCAVRPLFYHLDRMFQAFFARTTLEELLTGERQLARKLAAETRLPALGSIKFEGETA